MDKSNLRRVAIDNNERPREIRLYVDWYLWQYGQAPSYEEIAEYLQVKMNTVIDDIKLMRKNDGYQFTTHWYKRIA